jgi:hypothetical protein
MSRKRIPGGICATQASVAHVCRRRVCQPPWHPAIRNLFYRIDKETCSPRERSCETLEATGEDPLSTGCWRCICPAAFLKTRYTQ